MTRCVGFCAFLLFVFLFLFFVASGVPVSRGRSFSVVVVVVVLLFSSVVLLRCVCVCVCVFFSFLVFFAFRFWVSACFFCPCVPLGGLPVGVGLVCLPCSSLVLSWCLCVCVCAVWVADGLVHSPLCLVTRGLRCFTLVSGKVYPPRVGLVDSR